MKNKTKYFASAFKTKCQTIGILLLLLLLFEKVQAQQKFEFGMNVNSGYYFAEEPIMGYNIKDGIQLGIGTQVNYLINPKTKIGMGVNYNYIKSSDKVYYSPVRLMPDLSAIEIPFTVKRDILKNWFITAGSAVYWHTESIKPTDGALGKWELGTGYRFKNLAVSINYSQNFKNHDIRIESENSSSFGISEYKRRILTLKLEYSLWKF
jgi:hypothetical protein